MIQKLFLAIAIIFMSSAVLAVDEPTGPVEAQFCFVDAPLENQHIDERPCKALSDSDRELVKKLQDAILPLPLLYRTTAANLYKIFIETDPSYFGYNGYAWYFDFSDIRAPAKPYMRLGKNKLDEIMTGKHTFTSKFREKITKLFIQPIPEADLIVESNFDYFTHLLAHELTHVIDIGNQLNYVDDVDCAAEIFKEEFVSYPCLMGVQSYSAYGWIDSLVEMIPANAPALKVLLPKIYCGDCTGSPYTIADLYPLISELYTVSPFLTLYDTMDPWEDLADAAALQLMANQFANPKLKVKVVKPDGQYAEFDVLARFKDPALTTKMNFVRTMINNNNLAITK